MQTEEFEQIPWSQLLPPADDGRRRILYLVAGIVVALVAGVVAARWFADPAATVVAVSAPRDVHRGVPGGCPGLAAGRGT